MIFKQKKGNAITDTILVMVVLFIFVILAMTTYKWLGDVNDDIQADADLTNQSKEVTQNIYDRYPSVLDGLFIFLLGLLWILVLVASFMIDSHPIFFAVTLVLLVLLLIVAGLLSNAYSEFMEIDDMTGISSSFPMTHFIMSNFLVTCIVIALTVALVLFGKNRFSR